VRRPFFLDRLNIALTPLHTGLAKWSRREVDEEAISAIYVKLGNDYNVACAAFARENISMKFVGPALLLQAARLITTSAAT
jgi:hypothetical protein